MRSTTQKACLARASAEAEILIESRTVWPLRSDVKELPAPDALRDAVGCK